MLRPVKMSVHVAPQVKFPGDGNTPYTTTGYAMFGFNAQHTHFNPDEDTLAPGNVSHLALAWSARTGGIILCHRSCQTGWSTSARRATSLMPSAVKAHRL